MTDEELRAEVMRVLDYDQKTGVFRWKVSRGTKRAGSIAGSYNEEGYIKIMISKKSYSAHRIAYLVHHGHLPEFVDHINGRKGENMISNLRECTFFENRFNTTRRHNNKSGIKGVSLHKSSGKFTVYVQVNKVSMYLGLYSDIELAELVASEARAKYHGEFACD